MSKPIKWAYGVTTVPSRMQDLFPQTLSSLCDAGFDKPTIFLDGANHKLAVAYEERFKLEVVNHYPAIRTFGNWELALRELFIRNPTAHRYAIFQDDLVTYRNLRHYLERTTTLPNAYYNLYTFPQNQQLVPKEPNTNKYVEGWHKSNQMGRGAVGLVFDRLGVLTIMQGKLLAERPLDCLNGTSRVDGVVSDVLKKAGYTEYIHHPSLVQHLGFHSTMRSDKQEKAISFRGENFDALQSLVKPEERQANSAGHRKSGLGDRIEGALSAVGITSTRVEQWLGGPCGCEERKQKLNRLGAWVERVLMGKTEKAEEYLNQIIGD